MNERNIGFRDVNESPVKENLSWSMRQSPEGRQLSIDGSLVFAVVDDDPATTTNIPGNGRPVFYIRAGVLELWGYTRDTGWLQI